MDCLPPIQGTKDGVVHEEKLKRHTWYIAMHSLVIAEPIKGNLKFEHQPTMDISKMKVPRLVKKASD
jgi:hypothetical protein